MYQNNINNTMNRYLYMPLKKLGTYSVIVVIVVVAVIVVLIVF
jgi:hypothetical protein